MLFYFNQKLTGYREINCNNKRAWTNNAIKT